MAIIYEERKQIDVPQDRQPTDQLRQITGYMVDIYVESMTAQRLAYPADVYVTELWVRPVDRYGDFVGLNSLTHEVYMERFGTNAEAIRKAIARFDLECGKFEPEPEPEYHPQY